jgi:membrane-bound lytic murein transglycosylase B
MAYGELRALLRYAEAQGIDPLSMPVPFTAPSASASSCLPTPSGTRGRRRDGKADLFNVDDALMSLGNILVVMGWKPPWTRRHATGLLSYNHSKIYVNTISMRRPFA